MEYIHTHDVEAAIRATAREEFDALRAKIKMWRHDVVVGNVGQVLDRDVAFNDVWSAALITGLMVTATKLHRDRLASVLCWHKRKFEHSLGDLRALRVVRDAARDTLHHQTG
jgi:hypothetical protein